MPLTAAMSRLSSEPGCWSAGCTGRMRRCLRAPAYYSRPARVHDSVVQLPGSEFPNVIWIGLDGRIS